jgi:hypothetical protein
LFSNHRETDQVSSIKVPLGKEGAAIAGVFMKILVKAGVPRPKITARAVALIFIIDCFQPYSFRWLDVDSPGALKFSIFLSAA